MIPHPVSSFKQTLQCSGVASICLSLICDPVQRFLFQCQICHIQIPEPPCLKRKADNEAYKVLIFSQRGLVGCGSDPSVLVAGFASAPQQLLDPRDN